MSDQDEGADDCEACDMDAELEHWSTRAAVAERELAAERARCEALLHAVQAHNGNPLELIDDDIAEATLAIREAIKARSPVSPSPQVTQPKQERR